LANPSEPEEHPQTWKENITKACQYVQSLVIWPSEVVLLNLLYNAEDAALCMQPSTFPELFLDEEEEKGQWQSEPQGKEEKEPPGGKDLHSATATRDVIGESLDGRPVQVRDKTSCRCSSIGQRARLTDRRDSSAERARDETERRRSHPGVGRVGLCALFDVGQGWWWWRREAEAEAEAAAVYVTVS
jgi:hypothetical protein